MEFHHRSCSSDRSQLNVVPRALICNVPPPTVPIRVAVMPRIFAWANTLPALTAAIVGVRKPEHITSVLPAANWHLDAATMAEIDGILRQDTPQA